METVTAEQLGLIFKYPCTWVHFDTILLRWNPTSDTVDIAVKNEGEKS